MLVHLSATSPYICDISLGPIEQANRMSSAVSKTSFLDPKESFPRLQPIRTPLKLLAPDEVPMNTSVATASTTMTDIDSSRQTSLQPVWYTEQTIVDDQNEQHRSTLPTIESNSPEVESIRPPSLMRKSSTFTIDIPSTLNDSEKENAITSTQEEPKPSDESFRALEHLLGLGSAHTNLTMTTTAQESPKSNHESLSLTIVTPTELINQTTNSLHVSYAPAGGSLPSSQNILLMPTIESITEPSINSTMPPPFSVDSSDTEEPSSTAGTVINQDSFHFTDQEQEEEEEDEDTPKDDTDDFSFELNDFTSDYKDEPTIPPLPPPPPMITIRAPTSADVAYRALIKPRTSGRISQPVTAPSPLVKTLTARSSVPNFPTRVLRSSTRRASTSSETPNSTIEEVIQSNPEDQSFVNESKTDDDYPPIELVQVVSLSEDEEAEPEQNAGITLNLTESKEINSASPTSAEEADRSASSSCSSFLSIQKDATTRTDPKKPVLSREFTYNTPTARITRSSERRRSILINYPTSARVTQSLIPTIPEPEQPAITEEENVSICSIPSSSKSTLFDLSTNPTTVSEAPPMVLQKSLAGSASPSPNATPTIATRESERLSSNFSPRRNINPLHSSTPSIRNKSLQIVSIGEREQLSTTAPPQRLNIDLFTDDVEMIDNEQQIDIPVPIHHVADEGIQTSPEKPPLRIDCTTQTTPSLDPSSRRRFQTIEQQTTPIVPRSSSCQTTPMMIDRVPSEPSPPPQERQQITPLHSKAMVYLRRNVRFQFTPSTDARLAAKEKLQEEQRQQQLPSKQEIPIITDNEREEDTEDEMKKTKKKISTSKKKKIVPPTPVDDSSEEPTESPVPRTTRNQSRNDTDVISTTHPTKKPSKRSVRNEKKVEPEPIVTTTSPPSSTKRVNRKRANPKTSTTSPPETTSPTEPVPKRSKTLEVQQPVREPSPEPTSTRSRSKNPVSPPETVERPPPIPKKSKKRSTENHSHENKRKNPIATMKKGKRRLHSVEQDEGLNTADEEETVQTILLPPPEEIKTIELSQEERTKIEGLTVAELKNRLNTHGENIPKGARKADLVALVIKIETNLLQDQKQAEPVADPPARKTRRRK